MKIVVIGGTGLIGSKLVERLRQNGHEVVAASPNTGVNTITGEGLAEVLVGARVVADVANAPSFEDRAVLEFFQTSGRNLLAAEAVAGVRHHLALSVVGADRLPDSGYLRAKVAQEHLIKAASIPYTILRSTQFFELLGFLVNSWGLGDKVVVPAALIQPIASDDVADAMAEVALASPRNGTIEIAGPERFRIRDLIAKYLAATGDARAVEASTGVPYSGAKLEEATLVSDNNPRLGKIDFDQWFASGAKAA